MNIRLFLISPILILFQAVCHAQGPDNKTLLTVDGRKIQAGEFIRMYKKNLEPGKTLDIDSYLQQYIAFKLKVADAINEGYDTTNAFRNELNGYRDQLAQSYLTDTQIKEKLLQEAYKRSLVEINAWHILITIPQKASPEDTLKAWKKAIDIRERIIRGEAFEQVARSASDDKSAEINGGNLGYFTVFQMIMPFEDAVYSLDKGAISMPVRTPFGYHIIKVTDKRPSKGKIKVAHIMKVVPPDADEKRVSQAEEDINNIYKKLQEGTSFAELAQKYSDHKESSSKGGELSWFGTGEIVSEFSEAAFSITDTGNYTKPVRTNYGWHIIKLLDRKAPGSFAESRSFLESKINPSYLNSISKKALVEKLKNEYNFNINQAAYNWFVKNTDTLIIKGSGKYHRDKMPKGPIYSFANQHLTTNEFADFIEKHGQMVSTDKSSVFLSNCLATSASDHLINYENSVLEEKYPDFRYLMTEFRDGMLLFEISEKKIWNVVNEDSVGLHNYYEDHRNNYLTPRPLSFDEVQGEMISGYQEYIENKWVRQLKEKYNVKIDSLVLEEVMRSLTNE
ncbi:MAG: peptidyl-prolyl cis-trans isomerase [Bacteroidales bacterium]|nr:peptidyl-prolyl cis-trans isomerase [Bacteroidales bacterium]